MRSSRDVDTDGKEHGPPLGMGNVLSDDKKTASSDVGATGWSRRRIEEPRADRRRACFTVMRPQVPGVQA